MNTEITEWRKYIGIGAYEASAKTRNGKSFCEINECTHGDDGKCDYDDAFFKWLRTLTQNQLNVLNQFLGHDAKNTETLSINYIQCKRCNSCNRAHSRLEVAMNALDFNAMASLLKEDCCKECFTHPMFCRTVRLPYPRRPNNILALLTPIDICRGLGVNAQTWFNDDADTMNYRVRLAKDLLATLDKYWVPNRLKIVMLNRLRDLPIETCMKSDPLVGGVHRYVYPLEYSFERVDCIKMHANLKTLARSNITKKYEAMIEEDVKVEYLRIDKLMNAELKVLREKYLKN